MTRQYEIDQALIERAWQRVKMNGGAAGVDGISIKDFETNLDENLYKIWNRMSSGSYFPPAVKAVEIPKATGGTRTLGVPTVGDRVAQAAVKLYLEPDVEPLFHSDSYGYRPKRSALDAVKVARERCWKYNWALEIDIVGFFDNLDHNLVLTMVNRHTQEPWVLLYIKRWMQAPVQQKDGKVAPRMKGSPQGSVISPILSNIFMHHAFDMWMAENYKTIPFERYADDLLVHCRTKAQAEFIQSQITRRMINWSLELSPTKTKIVYCKDAVRQERHEHEQFDFLGFTFRARQSRNFRGQTFLNFSPAISAKAAKHIRATIASWKLSKRIGESLDEIADDIKLEVGGWLNYYGRFNKTATINVLKHVDLHLAMYVRRKYKRFSTLGGAMTWISSLRMREPKLLPHWYAVRNF